VRPRPKTSPIICEQASLGTQRNRRHVIAASYAFQGYNFRKSYPHASLQDFNAGFG
jgi:hypothetical protein